MKWFARGITVVFLVALGWLFFSPPTVSLDFNGPDADAHETVVCQAFGFGEPDTAPISGAIDLSLSDSLEEYLVATGHVDEEGEVLPGLIAQAQPEVQRLCQESRDNRQTEIIVVSVLFLGALVWWRTRPTPNHSVSSKSSLATSEESE